ncbi:MAG: hypothetical protein MJZ13_06120 [Bacteroidales bacterium]|nr:hypothetical protein [Bacteroidales bacterium]
MKKLFTLFVVLGAAFNAMADNVYGFAGSGTEADPYKISSASDFTTLAAKITSDNTGAGEYFILTADINFGGTEANPVQFPSVARAAITNLTTVAWGFQGVIDGNDKRISGIYHTKCDRDVQGQFNALISSLGEGGVVKNMIFTENNYVNTHQYVAPFVCVNYGGFVEDCTNYADITSVGMAAAGICSYIVKGKGVVRNCTNYGDIVASSYAAGIVGGSQSGASVGTTDAAYANVIVDHCVNYGNCSSTNGTGAAGIVGMFSGVVTNCTNNANINDPKGKYIAGIAASMSYVAGVSGNVNNGDITGSNYVSGIVSYIAKGNNEDVDFSDNINNGLIVGTGENCGPIFGGGVRTSQIITAVNELVVPSIADDNAPCYNLAGQRVDRWTKGIVIQNGKKFINK